MGAGKKNIKKRWKDYPPNVPRKLFHKLREYKFNRSLCALDIGVNSGHLSKLLNQGIEPKDNTIRKKMFLKSLKIRKQTTVNKDRPPQPEYIKQWRHLPTGERHKVIQEYLSWKQKKR
jgi:hypothetical protein